MKLYGCTVPRDGPEPGMQHGVFVELVVPLQRESHPIPPSGGELAQLPEPPKINNLGNNRISPTHIGEVLPGTSTSRHVTVFLKAGRLVSFIQATPRRVTCSRDLQW